MWRGASRGLQQSSNNSVPDACSVALDVEEVKGVPGSHNNVGKKKSRVSNLIRTMLQQLFGESLPMGDVCGGSEVRRCNRRM